MKSYNITIKSACKSVNHPYCRIRKAIENEWETGKGSKKKLKRKGFIDIKDEEKSIGVFSVAKQLNGEKLAFISTQIQHLFGLFHLRLGCIRTSNNFQEPKYYKLRNCFRSIVGLRVYLLPFRAATHEKSCLVYTVYFYLLAQVFFSSLFSLHSTRKTFLFTRKEWLTKISPKDAYCNTMSSLIM